MASLGAGFNRMMGRTRYVVCRLFLQLNGSEVAPLLGVLNQVARNAIETDGDLEVLGEGLVNLCQSLLQYDNYWVAAANEGDVIWNESEAAEYVNELFTDSAQRYLSQPDLSQPVYEDTPLTLPATHNLIVMIVMATEGEVRALETSLDSVEAMKDGLKALINLHYQSKLRAIQVHFSPARLGDELTNDQVLQNFPELITL